MTAATTTRSAYPPAVQDLIPRARALAEHIGEIPSRNRLKTELKIGAPKAKALLEALTATDFTLAEQTHPDPIVADTADLPAPEATPTAADSVPVASALATDAVCQQGAGEIG